MILLLLLTSILSSLFFSFNEWLCGPCIDFTVNDNAVEEDTSLVQVKAGKAEV